MKEAIQDQTRGQGMLEYGVIIILVAILLIVLLVIIGSTVGDMYSTIVSNI